MWIYLLRQFLWVLKVFAEQLPTAGMATFNSWGLLVGAARVETFHSNLQQIFKIFENIRNIQTAFSDALASIQIACSVSDPIFKLLPGEHCRQCHRLSI